MSEPTPLLRDLKLPAIILLVCLVPIAAGTFRLIGLAGVDLGPAMEKPAPGALAPLATHIAASVIFLVLGALQVSDGMRRRSPALHRRLGRIAAGAGLMVPLSGVWLLGTAGPGPEDGPLLPLFRAIFGLGIAAFLALGIAAIRRRDITGHRIWMTRAFALGAGTGLQPWILLTWMLAVGTPDPMTQGLLLGAGWLLAFTIGELWLARRLTPRPTRPGLA